MEQNEYIHIGGFDRKEIPKRMIKNIEKDVKKRYTDNDSYICKE